MTSKRAYHCKFCNKWLFSSVYTRICVVCNYPLYREDTIKFRAMRKRASSYEANIKRNYGLSIEDYAWMCQKQNWKCFLCQEEPKTYQGLVVDHCHKTNKVRGLLCNPCNTALGFVEKDGWLDQLKLHLELDVI